MGSFCNECNDTVLGDKTKDGFCPSCTRKKISSNILFNYYFHSMIGLLLPIDIIRLISFQCIKYTGALNITRLHNDSWLNNQKYSKVFYKSKKYTKKYKRLLHTV